MSLAPGLSVRGVAASARYRVVAIALSSLVGAALTGVLVEVLAANNKLVYLGVLAGFFLPIAIWKKPELGIVLMVLAAVLVEQFADLKPRHYPGDGTDHLAFFTSFSDSAGLSGIYATPAELVLLMIALIWVLKAVSERRLSLPRSHMAAGIAILLAIVLIGLVRGLAEGGNFKLALWETRPWAYVAILYLLASQLIRRQSALRALLWVVVLGTGFKGIQGTMRYIEFRHLLPRPESILAHEEAFFFGLFTVLTAMLWLYGDKSRLRWWATALLPFVTIANLGNNRRTSWAILAGCLIVLVVIVAVRLPERRRLLVKIMVPVIGISLVYVPLFWHSSGTIGQPARALGSLISPKSRDQQSNDYRKVEDANLAINIKASTPFGKGFGIPIDYVIPIPDITAIDSLVTYVPHDNILYIWMRLGIPGALAFWWWVGASMVAATMLARSPNRQLSMFGAFTACAIVGYLIEGMYDYGLFWFRIAVFMGCLFGALEAARAMAIRTQPAERPVEQAA